MRRPSPAFAPALALALAALARPGPAPAQRVECEVIQPLWYVSELRARLPNDVARCRGPGPTPEGSVMLSVSVDRRGRVVESRLVEADRGLRSRGRCLARRIRAWRFDNGGAPTGPYTVLERFAFR